MKIGLIGYGTMGKTIERIAKQRKHSVPLIIDVNNRNDLTLETLQRVDVVIEFTVPQAAAGNIRLCLDAGKPIVCGTTGWLADKPEIEKRCKREKAAFLYASNFSLGVNIFFEINRQLAKIMDKFHEYDVKMSETHHTRKLDAPSGTAISLAQGIIENIARKNHWVSGKEGGEYEIPIEDFREGDVPGIHTVQYESEVDTITLTHDAKNRAGFALGAVLAAEFIQHKEGIFTMKDVLFNG